MSLATVRAAITGILTATVGSSANVHDYFRVVRNESEKEAILVKSGALHAWMVCLADEGPFITLNSQGQEGRSPMQEIGRYRFSLHGYFGVTDAAATEKTWATTVESIVTAFRANKRLGLQPPVGKVIDAGPCFWRRGGHVLMPPGEGGVLCHYALLELNVREQTEP